MRDRVRTVIVGAGIVGASAAHHLAELGETDVLVIDQADVSYVEPGQEVDIMLDELPGQTFQGTIQKKSKTDLRVSPRHLSGKAGGRRHCPFS